MPKYIVHTRFNGQYIKDTCSKMVMAEGPEEAKAVVMEMYRVSCERGREQSRALMGDLADTMPLPELEITGVEEHQEGEWR